LSSRNLIHGLVVESDVPLEGRPPPEGAPVDVRVTRGAGEAPPAEGEVVCEIVLPAGLGTYIARARPDGYVLTYGAFAFHVARDLGRVEWWAPGEDPQAVGHMVSGNVLAFLLQLMGSGVLHASVVRSPAGTIAFAGHSGAGKSTLAALFCECGAALLTDDVLRLDITAEAVMAVPGGTALRLRPAAEVVAARMSGSHSFRHEDGRMGIRPPLVSTPQALDHVLLPVIREEIEAVEVRRLARRDALLAMLSVPRWFGWRIPDPPRAQFRVMSALSDRVPVSELRLPLQGDPPSEIVAKILEQLR
jgi:hypothetical protein